ncbi:MAG: PaaI family thioesterase [Elusimicrobiota bacterium]
MPAIKPPELDIPAHCEPIDPFAGFTAARSFISRNADDDRLSIRYFRDRRDGAMTSWAWFGPGAEGAPGRIHGGSVSAILDEALGAAVWTAGIPVVTVKLTVKYRRPLNVGTLCTIAPVIVRQSGKRVRVIGTLNEEGNGVIAEAEAVYYRLSDAEIPQEAVRIMRERRGEA